MKGDVVQNSNGQLCPMPIVHMSKAMKKMTIGQVLELYSDDEGAHADVPAWAEQTGNQFLGEEKADGYFKYFVKKVK